MIQPTLTLIAIPNIPTIHSGNNITSIILEAITAADIHLQAGDILAIAQKVISKAEGRFVQLSTVTPSQEAQALAQKTAKDPRLVELILQESDELSRFRPGVLIVRHRLGFTSANAGIDHSNVGADDETVLLLPRDPDSSAQQIRQQIFEQTGVKVGIIISDSHGRPFRLGTVGVAIGVAGIPALWDRRGEQDMYGYTLAHTDVGVADEIAAAAGLLMGQAGEGLPVILLRGLQLPASMGQATDLIRPKEMDLYR